MGGNNIPDDLKRQPSRYNSDHLSQADCNNHSVMIYLPYPQAVALKNLLFDFHNEIDPSSSRLISTDPKSPFYGYPLKEMEPVHQQAYSNLQNALIATEMAAKDEKTL